MDNGRDAMAGEGIRVLAVDEDPVYLETLREMLRRCGYQVTAVVSPAEALRVVMENPEGVDLVLTVSDIRGTGIDGFALLERIKDRYPVILFSDNVNIVTMRRGFKCGACDFLTKPLHDSVIRNIWHHVKQPRLKDAPSAIPVNDDSHRSQVILQYGPSRKRPIELDDSEEGASNDKTIKKAKFLWNAHTHALFLNADNRLKETQDYIPKNIGELMEDDGANATTDQVSSHLQKYKGNCLTTASASLSSSVAQPVEKQMPTMDNPNNIRNQDNVPQLYHIRYDCKIGGMAMSLCPLDDGADLRKTYLGGNEVMQNTTPTDMAQGIQKDATVEMTHEMPRDGDAGQTNVVQHQGFHNDFFNMESTNFAPAGTSGGSGLTNELIDGINLDELENLLNQQVWRQGGARRGNMN